MSNAFDPYHTWLGIAPSEQPPNHYRLLGIALYESDPDVISNAADRQMAHIRTFQSGKYSKESQKILNELSAARVLLLDPKKHAEYDAKLRAASYAAMPNQGMPNQNMPAQGYPMPHGQIPMNQPMAMGQPMPPQPPVVPQQIPPVIQPAPVNLGGRTSSIKKHKKQKEDPTKIVLIVGGIAILLLFFVFILSSGNSKKEIAQTSQETALNSPEEKIDPSEFDYSGEIAELPERAVQENILSNTPVEASEKKEPTVAKPVEKEKPENDTFNSSINEDVTENFIIPKAENDEADAAESTDEDAADEDDSPKRKKKKSPDSDAEESPQSEKSNTPGISNDEIMNIGRGVVRHVEPNRSKIIKFYGGNEKDFEKLMLGVDWIMDKTVKAGSDACLWNFDHTLLLNGKKRPGSKNFQNPGIAKNNVNSATALAMMAVLGAGEISTKEFLFLNRAVQFLYFQAKPASKTQQILVAQRESAKRVEASLVEFPSTNKNLHAHAWGTIAICDYLALVQEKKELKSKTKIAQITEFAQALVRHIGSQQASDGSFPAVEAGLDVDFKLKYVSSSSGSITSTVWNLMALKAAKNAGLQVSNEDIMKATDYLAKKITALAGSHKTFKSASLTSLRELRAAFFGVTLFGENLPEYAKAASLAEQLTLKADEQQLEGNLFSSMLIRDLRGESWDNWREKVLTKYFNEQSSDKIEAGSWFYGGEEVNNEGGRLYCTAMTLLILESIYRYEPLRPLDESETFQLETNEEIQVPADGNAFPIQREPEEEAGKPAGAETAKTNAEAEKEEPEAESFMDTSNLDLTSDDDDSDE